MQWNWQLAMQTPLRQKRPNFRIPYLAPPNAALCTVPPGADAPPPRPLSAATELKLVWTFDCLLTVLFTRLAYTCIIGSSESASQVVLYTDHLMPTKSQQLQLSLHLLAAAILLCRCAVAVACTDYVFTALHALRSSHEKAVCL